MQLIIMFPIICAFFCSFQLVLRMKKTDDPHGATQDQWLYRGDCRIKSCDISSAGSKVMLSAQLLRHNHKVDQILECLPFFLSDYYGTAVV